MPFGRVVAVSPLIRAARWGLLLAGIIYARGKQKLYNTLAAHDREEAAKRKVIRDKEMAILKAKIAADEKATLKLLETGKLFEPGVLEGKRDPCD